MYIQLYGGYIKVEHSIRTEMVNTNSPTKTYDVSKRRLKSHLCNDASI